MKTATDNFKEIELNDDFVNTFEAMESTRDHIFVTGKAGTGKSTLLEYFRYKTQKEAVVLAPTGVAAINIKGQTIHSFFQFKPDITPEAVADIRMRKKKRELFMRLEAIVIDEISMVRADLMDCINTFLRIYGPNPDRPFGGVQMIFFGDLFQLPPVVRSGEEEIFKDIYESPYFYSADVMQEIEWRTLELQKVYRQKDQDFIHLLNAIREDELSGGVLEKINSRVDTQFQSSDEDFYISLTTTNALAEQINLGRLKRLSGDSIECAGILAGEFEQRNLPTQENLEIKIGAQVMLLNNDMEKRWVNGSIGRVVSIEPLPEGSDIIMVELSDGRVVDVTPFTWNITQFYFNEETQMLDSKVVGYFTQYPLKLAWAVTIHKSQGLTFDRVIIDIGRGTFSHGQVYVALSRCTSLEGIVLRRPIFQRHILLDQRIRNFSQERSLL